MSSGSRGIDATIEELVARAKDLEARGFDSMWMANIFGLDAIGALGIIGHVSERIELGTAVVPSYPRHPAAMAQQCLTTQAASKGRFVLGIGLSHQIVIEKGSPKRMGPFMVTRCMSSTNSATLATPFRIKGVNYSITSACSTSAHCIGNGVEQIQMGKQDIVFAGGGEELDWTLSCLFDAMGAMSSKYNDTPETASRPYDATRDGFVIAGGGGVVVLEELDHALARGAKIYAEVTGYGATSDGHDMVAPSGEGGERSMRLALETLPEGRELSYINAHGTSTPVGDIGEVNAIRRIFGEGATPPISSTKSLTGHSLGATGVHEAIYCLLMLQNDFIAASANVETLDPAIRPSEIATTRVDEAGLDSVLSNSFGFGGTNASLLLSRYLE
jgi:3-oxoacyl-[acyl-carrier-protein] synthase-1